MIVIYECPNCGYKDSDKEMASNHCLDNQGGLW
jgi:C4-type Zn-finger protein